MRIAQEPKRITSVIVIIKPDSLLKKLSYLRTKEEENKQTKKPKNKTKKNPPKTEPKIVSIRFSSPNVHTLSQQDDSGRDVQELGSHYYGTNDRDSYLYNKNQDLIPKPPFCCVFKL